MYILCLDALRKNIAIPQSEFSREENPVELDYNR